MLQIIRSLMPYGHLQISVKSGEWLLEQTIITEGTPQSKVYIRSKSLESGLSELLEEVRNRYSVLLKKLEEKKKNPSLFELS